MHMSTRRGLRVAGAFAARGIVAGFALAVVWPGGASSPATASATQPLLVDWVDLPAGTFMMGCVPADAECYPEEEPRHRVELTRGFAIMRTEVTIAQYEAVAPRMGARLPRQPRWNSGPDHPVVNITWGDARDVCIGLGGRLPTEAEWEYAARGGLDGAIFPWGNEPDQDMVNAAGVRGADAWEWAAPVGSFPPNGFGLHDLSGNVWEWVADRYAPTYQSWPSRDPRGPESGPARVMRGGSWDSKWPRVRVSVRESRHPFGRYNLYVGVRCARDGTTPAPASSARRPPPPGRGRR